MMYTLAVGMLLGHRRKHAGSADTAPQPAPPASIQEPRQRVQKVLGRFDPDDYHEWSIVTNDEHRTEFVAGALKCY